MHEKLTAFLELEAALWLFNQTLSLVRCILLAIR
jgi:hypothetical protein